MSRARTKTTNTHRPARGQAEDDYLREHERLTAAWFGYLGQLQRDAIGVLSSIDENRRRERKVARPSAA